MERALDSLKTRLGRTEDRSKVDYQRKVGENEQLIGECNSLRREVRELRSQLDKAQSELRASGSGPKAPGGTGRRTPSAGLLRPTTADSTSSLLTKPLGVAGGSSGRLLKGSAGVMGRERARTAEVLMTLEANQREMAVQRAEILRLREQVHTLSGAEDGGAPNDDNRPQSSQERPMSHTPVQRQPRAASALD